MIDIKDNAGNVLFTGSTDEANEFLKHKIKLEKKAKEKDLDDWCFAVVVGVLICFAVMIVYKFITS